MDFFAHFWSKQADFYIKIGKIWLRCLTNFFLKFRWLEFFSPKIAQFWIIIDIRHLPVTSIWKVLFYYFFLQCRTFSKFFSALQGLVMRADINLPFFVWLCHQFYSNISSKSFYCRVWKKSERKWEVIFKNQSFKKNLTKELARNMVYKGLSNDSTNPNIR